MKKNIKENYSVLKDTYSNEKFFMSYALRGPMIDPEEGIRADIPVNHPIKGPVSEPSPLNNRWIYDLPDVNMSGIL